MSATLVSAPPSFGAALIGFAASCFLTGCMLVQCYIYAKSETAQRDNTMFKYFIATLWFIDVLHLIIMGIYIYGALIVHFNEPLYLFNGPWSFDAVTALSTLTSTPVQVFYAWRVYVLGKRNLILPSIIVFLSLVAFTFSQITTGLAKKAGNFAKYDSFTWAVDVWLGSNVVTDVLIVACLYYFLSRGRTGFKSTDQLIDKLVYIISSTGLAPTIMELAHIISFSAAPHNFAHLTFNFIAPKLYVNSLLASLNARTLILKWDADSSTRTADGPVRSRSERFELRSVGPGGSGTSKVQNRADVFDKIKVTKEYEQSYE